MKRVLALVLLLVTMATAQAADAPVDEGGLVKQGIKAFTDKKYDDASKIMTQVQEKFPKNPWAAYYLGLLHLNRGETKPTIRQWRLYLDLDPAGAKANGVPARLTQLVEEERKHEAKTLVDQEKSLSSLPASPNSVAVFPFSNQGEDKYNVLAKGLTALVITDLAKVPGLKVLEREKVQKLVDEIKLSQSGLTAKDAEMRTGRILRAEKLMTGDYLVKE